jgi:hypothetical protein
MGGVLEEDWMRIGGGFSFVSQMFADSGRIASVLLGISQKIVIVF